MIIIIFQVFTHTVCNFVEITDRAMDYKMNLTSILFVCLYVFGTM